MPRRRAKRTAVEVDRRITQLMADYSAEQILSELERAATAGELDAKVPGLRTIQRRVAELRSAINAKRVEDAWSPATDETGEPALALEILGAVIRSSGAAITQISRANALRATNLARALPDLDLGGVWMLTVEYERRDHDKMPTTDLDGLLALSPWKTGAGWAIYERVTAMVRESGVGTPALPAAPESIVWYLKMATSGASKANADSQTDSQE